MRSHRGSLDDFLEADDIVPLPCLTDGEWDTVRNVGTRALLRQFLTLRNLWVHRGQYARDALGFSWGGIYRSLLVGSIVTTSYRNEGHLRAGERIFGTGDFFRGGFVMARPSADFQELVRLVNLRHHVAGVVEPHGGGVRVRDGYEADYAYVATSFIESTRRGLAMCGLAPDSPRGRMIGRHFCTILYQLAGFTGLTRMPRDLAAHERFRDAYDRHLRDRPPSARVRRMAQAIAGRIVPLTAAMADETVRGHVRRHLDPETAGFLFPTETGDDLESQRVQWCERLRTTTPAASTRGRSTRRAAIWQRPDVTALHEAYRAAGPQLTNDRLIGAILLHAIDTGDCASEPFEHRTIQLDAGEPLIRQGSPVHEMYVVLQTESPLFVLHACDADAEPHLVATLSAPTVLGEIGMWRGQPASATVLSRERNRLELLVIDRRRFESLEQEPGFRAATAAEVQRRLRLNAATVVRQLDETAAATGDVRLVSVVQLVRYLSGDSHVPLDVVIELPDEATPAECVEALRNQVDALIATGGLAPELARHLGDLVVTIG